MGVQLLTVFEVKNAIPDYIFSCCTGHYLMSLQTGGR